MGGVNQGFGHGSTAGFSWLDLGATWNFATQNGNASSSGSQGDMDDGSLGGFGEGVGWKGEGGFDLGVLTDYSLLEGDNPNLIF